VATELRTAPRAICSRENFYVSHEDDMDRPDFLITNVSIEELTETYGDVGDLGVPIASINTGYDNQHANVIAYTMALMYNLFIIALDLLIRMKSVFTAICQYIKAVVYIVSLLINVVLHFMINDLVEMCVYFWPCITNVPRSVNVWMLRLFFHLSIVHDMPMSKAF